MSTLVEGLGNILGPVLGFIVGLIPLILVHEFGHLIMGKIMGVWAHEFGIGYPPRMLKLFSWQETDFTLNWLPFGGFVRFEGEATFKDEDEDEGEGDGRKETARRKDRSERKERSLYAKPPWQRILVYLGGPAMNLLTAWLIAILIFTTGIPQLQAIVSEVAPNSPAAEANLQSGDALVAVDGVPIDDATDLQTEIQQHAGERTTFTIERDGETLEVTLTPREDPPEGQGAIGVMISNQEVEGALRHYPLGEAVRYGSRYFANVGLTTLALPILVIRMGIPFEQARPVGVVGISQIAEQSVSQSIEQSAPYPFLNILVLLSISLGIFNLLPIPALDGGRILFSLIEAIRGKALTPELEERIHLVALLLMVVLFVFVTILDIVMPVPLQ